MAYEILSAKLVELDSEFASLHSRIRMSDRLSGERLNEEIAGLQVEIEDQINLVHASLEQSKAEVAGVLLKEFDALKDKCSDMLCSLEREIQGCEDKEFKNEKQILAAEYGIDFAVIAAKYALLKALEASRDAAGEEEENHERS